MTEELDNKIKPAVEIFTGVRPTGGLTVANYMGAIEPIVNLVKEGHRPMVFVADLHAMTDRDPSEAKKYIHEVVADYIALGLNPDKTTIFVQSDIGQQISMLTTYLARLISTSELLRVPTLKDKLKDKANPETANALLLLYPVMMAADILIQRAGAVPVGEDQVAHLEITRKLARRFNEKFGDVFPVPKVHQVKSLRIKALKGEGKMSKTSPETAIFLSDDKETVAKKIKRAQTDVAGELNDSLKSHFTLAKGLGQTAEDKQRIEDIEKAHMNGENVMGDFKNAFTEITIAFLEKFQTLRDEVLNKPGYIENILEEGRVVATKNANETVDLVEKAMKAR